LDEPVPSDPDPLGEEGRELPGDAASDTRFHLLPPRGDINGIGTKVEKGKHRLKKSKGLHTRDGGNWNKEWKEFFRVKEKRTKKEILDQLARMRKRFGI